MVDLAKTRFKADVLSAAQKLFPNDFSKRVAFVRGASFGVKYLYGLLKRGVYGKAGSS